MTHRGVNPCFRRICLRAAPLAAERPERTLIFRPQNGSWYPVTPRYLSGRRAATDMLSHAHPPPALSPCSAVDAVAQTHALLERAPPQRTPTARFQRRHAPEGVPHLFGHCTARTPSMSPLYAVLSNLAGIPAPPSVSLGLIRAVRRRGCYRSDSRAA